jgi:hypothetical protein
MPCECYCDCPEPPEEDDDHTSRCPMDTCEGDDCNRKLEDICECEECSNEDCYCTCHDTCEDCGRYCHNLVCRCDCHDQEEEEKEKESMEELLDKIRAVLSSKQTAEETISQLKKLLDLPT